MDAVLFGGEPIRDKSAMVERVVDDVRRFYEGEVNEELLGELATKAVGNVWGDGPLVTKYVPMFAIREVRSRVLDDLEARLAAGERLPSAAERDTWVWNTQHGCADPRIAPAA
jgi:hypothetical protein